MPGNSPDSNKRDETDPLAWVGEYEEELERLAAQDREDVLDALVRCALAAHRGEELPLEDCKDVPGL
jgi:hypothetical protein